MGHWQSQRRKARWRGDGDPLAAVTLRLRLTVAFVLVVLVPLLTGLLLVARALPRAVHDSQQADVGTSARLVAQVLAGYCERAGTTAEAAGRAGTLADARGVRAIAQSFVDRGMADGVQVSGPTGAAFVSVGTVPAAPVDCASRAGVATAPQLSAVVHLSTATGGSAGTATATFDLAGEPLQRLAGLLNGGDVLLVTSQGKVAASTTVLAPQTVAALIAGRSHDTLVSGYVPPGALRPFGVLVVVEASRGNNVLVQGAVIISLALLAAVGIAVVSARSTTRPLAELGDAATRIASGDLSTMIEVRSKDEVGRLAVAFNTMTDELRGYVGELQESHVELQAGLSRLGDTLSSTHDLDRILNVVLESAMAATRAKGGMLLLLSAEEETLSVSASRGVNVPVDLQLKLGDGISGKVARSGNPVRGQIGHGKGQLRAGNGEPTDMSVIAVPLKSSGTVIGVLDLFGSPRAEGFDENDLGTIQTFAGQATVAIDNVLLHEETQLLAITDELTGLPNYRYFAMTLGKEIERAARFSRPLSLLMLDLDLFKGVNDTFGHQRGDAVLSEVAQRIMRKVRDVDTVCRYGGEEFVLILPETDAIGAAKLAERICAAMRRKAFGPAGVPPVHLTVSIGIAVFPDHGTSASPLLRQADEALYEVKASGRNGWRVAGGAPVSVSPD
ncbi:MAG: diguanylate cyclase with sensor [Frankiales bacterium]|nr:diguanylate cyclase with sensor [Frankiales bacterium]